MEKNGFVRKTIVYLVLILGLLLVTSCGSQGVTSDEEKNNEIVKTTYSVEISLEGGSGKATIQSPVTITEMDGQMSAKLVWTSKNYDYMIVGGVRYENENVGGDSTFTVDIENTTEPLKVIGDTTAMSTSHEIEYVIHWGEKGAQSQEVVRGTGTDRAAVQKALEAAGLSRTGEYELSYATGFQIHRYGEIDHISIENSGEYVVVPEGKEAPAGLPEGTVVMKKPFDCTYLVSTSAMDLLNACGALDRVKLSGSKESDWYIPEAKEAMKAGTLVYAGKYRAPDYELLLESGCDLAIENTMIYHEPAVRSKLTELGIPVLVETSSYEKHPLGRLEWIKLYGVLFDKEQEAETFFREQVKRVEPLLQEKKDTGKKVAFFHVTAGGLINVRKSGDYITRMIELSGGHYVPNNTGEGENALSTMNMQMEDFYREASDADVIIINSTIGGEVASVDELMEKNELFRDFKAGKTGKVYCTTRDLFQKITGMAEFMQDLNDIFHDVDREYTYLKKLE